MKRYLAIFAVALTIGGGLTACAGTQAGDLFRAATKEIVNPVTPTNIHEVKLVYEASQNLVMKYQRDCFGSDARPYPVTLKIIRASPVLSVQCAHRVSRYNAMKLWEGRANKAILEAEAFISANPKGNAVSYITAAWRAVSAYRTTMGGK